MLHIQVGETVKHKRSFLEQSKLCNGVKSTRLAPNQGIEEKKRAERKILRFEQERVLLLDSPPIEMPSCDLVSTADFCFMEVKDN